MFIRDFCIQRPVFAIVINLVLLLAGLIAVNKLSVRQLPEFVVPVITVTTAYIGATSRQIETQITTPIEQAVSSVADIDVVTSVSRDNASVIQIQFKGDVDPGQSTDEVRSKVAEAQGLLPSGASTPVVQRFSLDSQPVLYLSITDSSRNALELTDYISRSIRPALVGIPGVATLSILGARDYAVRIKLKPTELAANNLTVEQLVLALQQQNALVPGGSLILGAKTATVEATTTLNSVEALGQTVLKRSDEGFQLTLADVASLSVEASNSDSSVRVNGQSALAIGIQRQSEANPVDISRAVRARLPSLRQQIPATMTVTIAYDSAVYIEASVVEVFDTLAITTALVIGVVLLTLGTLRASLIALVTIPLSLAGGLGFLLLMGYSLNMFTLLAFVLVIGLVVDDAIVEIENIQRHVDDGLDGLAASFKGSREIGFAVVAMTLTLAAVYAPIGLLPGLIGALFSEFAFTLAATVLISGFIAMTLSPMMTARLLRPTKDRGLPRIIEKVFKGLAWAYYRLLEAALNQRWLVLVVALIGIGAGGVAMSTLQGEMAPAEDQGYILVAIEGPTAASQAYMLDRTAAVGAVLDAIPEAATSLVISGSPTVEKGTAFALLKPLGQRSRSAAEIMADIEPKLAAIPGVRAVPLNPDPLGGGGQLPVQFILRGDLSAETLFQQTSAYLDAVRAYPGLEAMQTDLTLDKPIIRLNIDRPQAADLGIDTTTIGQLLETLFGDIEVNKMSWDGKLYPVFMELAADTISPQMLESLYLIGQSGTPIPLASIAQVETQVGPGDRRHFNQLSALTIQGKPAPGYSLTQVINDLRELAQKQLPPAIQTDVAGAARALETTSASTGLVFVFALVFIYFVLAAQFESFRDPFIILSIAPFAVVGAGVGLWATGGSLNLYSGIGFITLIGLIAKHGILITEFTNVLRDTGLPLRGALLRAATLRLRPIIMTTAAMVLGAVPLVLATGAGAASRHQIGVVIIAGMLFGTLLSLFVVPVVYSLLSRKIRRPLAPIPNDAELEQLS